MGCYAEGIEGRALEEIKPAKLNNDGRVLPVVVCRGYRYYGLEDGSSCGHSIRKGKKKKKEEEKKKKLPGKSYLRPFQFRCLLTARFGSRFRNVLVILAALAMPTRTDVRRRPSAFCARSTKQTLPRPYKKLGCYSEPRSTIRALGRVLDSQV